jgi:hypothetical protein
MTQESIIRDRSGNRIGSISDNGHQLIGRDRNGNILAYFDKASNSTRDRNGNRVAEGNILSSFIMEAAGH